MLDTPLTFIPILVPKVWGGQRLQNIGKQLPAGEPIGESWELADMPGKGPCSVVASGPFAGRTLRHILDTHQHDIMGTVPPNGTQEAAAGLMCTTPALAHAQRTLTHL